MRDEIKLFTNGYFFDLGDEVGDETPLRECRLIWYDGKRDICYVQVGEEIDSVVRVNVYMEGVQPTYQYPAGWIYAPCITREQARIWSPHTRPHWLKQYMKDKLFRRAREDGFI